MVVKKVIQVGNACGVIIDKYILTACNITKGDIIDIDTDGQYIIIRKHKD